MLNQAVASQSKTAILWLLFTGSCVANENREVSGENDSDVGVNIHLSTQQQQFSDSDANFSYVQLTPYWVWNNWDVMLNVAYLNIEGNYFNNGAFPRYQEFCSRILGMRDRFRDLLVATGRLSQEQVNSCQANSEEADSTSITTSGIGDISLGLSYSWELAMVQPALMYISAELSWDNGDYFEGLGSGSQDFILQWGALMMWDKWTGSAALGYAFVNPTDALEDIDDYAFISLAMDYDINERWRMGVTYAYEQAYLSSGGEINSLTLNNSWKMSEHVSASLYFTAYAKTDFYPESEIGGALQFGF